MARVSILRQAFSGPHKPPPTHEDLLLKRMPTICIPQDTFVTERNKVTTIFQAIYENETGRVYIEYEPGPNGAIFILSVSIEVRPVTSFQERRNKRRRGIVLGEAEEHTEQQQPYTAREAVRRTSRIF